MPTRTERDPLGEKNVPAEAYYGIQTQRAIENFPISGLRASATFVVATILVKRAAAEANVATGQLDREVGEAIMRAADEILDGQLRDQFVVDVYQAGAGTSHNMNANEVLANRAAELLGERRGTYKRVHPNDHVNMGQSTNDVFPTATRLALLLATVAPPPELDVPPDPRTLEGALPVVVAGSGRALFQQPTLAASARRLAQALDEKAGAFAHIMKAGRTHLMDAVPITLGQEFSGFAASVASATDEVERAARPLHELNLGATAVGTGLNADRAYTEGAAANLARLTGLDVVPAANAFRVTQSMGDVAGFSGAVRRLAIEVGKIASDLRLLGMGPRAGLSEILLPAVQPGSSIMPGKVNPSVPEMVNQVVFQVMGCDMTVAISAEHGQLELNVMMPVIAWNALHACTILANAMDALRRRTIEGLVADEARCRELLDRSTAAATALSPYIGYAATAEVAKEAVRTGTAIRDLVLTRGLLSKDEIDRILSVEAMTSPGVVGRTDASKSVDAVARQKS
ncbi:MAG: aspartate ammonia-lyase [Luteitalea sp.]|nr:aspartate ammonia-lyase [Luteitalea sp.]